ncbi:acyl-CoA dehydrogenase family protein [Thermoplasma sp.]|uniref:acyl-CoA dehydrogenase family protein n=1 Tax=Thermoplasma sp. TaxID=1973142 RepID=UPI001278BB45|nr:acyl-CoA dehydrogenase family protein [Thermoplasma sp.]KAA8922752.1 MAG: acyl-CoA dehydrogenase [Thermoplasma sp.]
MMEEYEILRNTVREFATKEIEPVSKDIELNGIQRQLKEKIAGQGFIGATLPAEKGGAGLDENGYMIILEETAKASPSVSTWIFLTNLYLKLYPDTDQKERIMSGSVDATVDISPYYLRSKTNPLTVTGGKLTGRRTGVINGTASSIIVSDGTNIYAVNSGMHAESRNHLGLRGMDLSDIDFDSSSYEKVGSEEKLRMELKKSDGEIASIFLGLADGTMQKAIDYSKVRTAFDHPLKDYTPIFDEIVNARTQIDLIRFYLYGNQGEYARALCKVKAKDIALTASRSSLQIHGGYGYIHDFGIEKYYRDAMALAVYFGDDSWENGVISQTVMGEKGGII